MRFVYHRDLNIPHLAWCLKLEQDNPDIYCVHGDWVETNPAFFVEGGWAEDYATGGLIESATLMGSGGVANPASITLCTPCHVFECLYSTRFENVVVFSNSLAFLLTTIEDKLDPRYMNYESDILSIIDGIKKYIRYIPTQSGRKVELHYYCNITVDRQLRILRRDKPASPLFANYDAYRQYLLDKIRGIDSNLTDSQRKNHFAPIVFCSSGYDSTACAVLGRTVGCKEAVLFESRKSIRSDSGKDIVNYLGYTVIHEKNEVDYLQCNIAEEFVSSGELGTSIYYGAAQTELAGKYLISGDYGDEVWDRYNINPNLEFAQPRALPNTAMKEFRLRVGFIKVVIPFFGADRVCDIVRISNSKELAPWVVGGGYDKPIPRRIVEEAGILRGSFAVRKDGGVGNSLRFLGLTHLRKVMPPENYRDFQQYYREHRIVRENLPTFIQRSLRYIFFVARILLCKAVIKNNIPFIKADKLVTQKNWHRSSCSPWAPSLLFNWGIQKVMARYENAGRQFQKIAQETQMERQQVPPKPRGSAGGRMAGVLVTQRN